MSWRLAGITVFFATMIAGCAASPTAIESENVIDNRGHSGHTSGNGPVQNAKFLDRTQNEHIVSCRNVAPTGSRIRRTVCGPKKDDSELFSIIDAGGPFDVHQ